MHYRRLGRSGLKVSEISLGSWVTFGAQLNEKQATRLLHAAYDQGINYFDTADSYANGQAEVILGKAIHDLPRQALVISTKVFAPTMPGPNGRGLSRKHITESIKASLHRLNMEYIDIYLCHRYDPDTPMEEVVRAMSDLIQQGHILYWGTSEWEASQVAQAFGTARQYNLIPPITEQSQYNLFRRRRVEERLMPICREFGLGLTTFSPLFSGLLSGKYNERIPEGSRATMPDMAWLQDSMNADRIRRVRMLTSLAQEFELTTAQLAIAWLLRRKEVSSVITGASHPEQLDENLYAAQVVDSLNDSILDQIEEIFEGYQESETF